MYAYIPVTSSFEVLLQYPAHVWAMPRSSLDFTTANVPRTVRIDAAPSKTVKELIVVKVYALIIMGTKYVSFIRWVIFSLTRGTIPFFCLKSEMKTIKIPMVMNCISLKIVINT